MFNDDNKPITHRVTPTETHVDMQRKLPVKEMNEWLWRLILFRGMSKGSKATMAELVGKGMRIHEDSRRWTRVTEFRIYTCETMRLMFLSLPTWEWSKARTHLSHLSPPHSDKDTLTQTEEDREKQTRGEEDGKDVNMFLGRSLKDEYTDTQWKTKYILKIRWVDGQMLNKETKQKSKRWGEESPGWRSQQKTTEQIKAVERENVTALVLVTQNQLLFSVLLCHVSSAGFVLYSLCPFVSVCCSCLGSLSLCLPWVPRLATFVSVLYVSTSQFLVCVFVNVMLPVLFW